MGSQVALCIVASLVAYNIATVIRMIISIIAIDNIKYCEFTVNNHTDPVISKIVCGVYDHMYMFVVWGIIALYYVIERSKKTAAV